MAAAELKLQVGLDLAFFRQQLAQLASASVGYSLPINIDRLAIQKEITKLGRNISSRKYTLKIDTTVKSAASDISNLQKALEELEKKSVNVQITGTGNLNPKEARRIRAALGRSVLSNGGKIKIPTTIQAAITKDDVTAFRNAVKSKLAGISVDVKANVRGKGFAGTEQGYEGLMGYMQKQGLIGKTASGMTGQMGKNGDNIKQQLGDAVKSAEKIKSIFDGVAQSIATTGKSTANVQGKRLGLGNVPLMAGGVERRIEQSSAAIGATLSADALKALYPEVSKTIASFVALKGQIQQNTSKLSGFSLILGLAAFAGVPLAKSVVKLTGSADSFAKLLDQLGLKLDAAFTNAAFNILSATSGRMLSGGSVAGLLPAAYRGIGGSTGPAGLLPPAYRGIGSSRNAGALPPAYRGLPAAYRGIGASAGVSGLLPPAYRGIGASRNAGAIGGTAFGSQKYLPTALGDETKKVLRDAAYAFLRVMREEMRKVVYQVNVQDLGQAINRQAMLPGGRTAGYLPPVARFGVGRDPNPYSTGRLGREGETQAELFARREREARVKSAFREMALSTHFTQPQRLPGTTFTGDQFTAGGGRDSVRGTGQPPQRGGALAFRQTPLTSDYYKNAFRYSEALKVADASMRNFSASQIPFLGGLRGVAGELGQATKQVLLYGTAYRALAAITAIPGQILDAAKSQQQYTNGLKVATQETGTFAKELLFVDNVQRAFGLNLETTRTGFTRLYASMAPTGFDSGSIEKLFTGISAATAALQLTPDKAERVIYAFGQMASKGQIMSEELKGQLGDVLPGALAIFAKSAGMSVKEFSKAMEDGEFVGNRFREVFAKVSDELMNRFGTGAQAAGKSLQGLLSTVGGDFQRTLESFAPLANNVAQAILVPLGGALRQLSTSAQIAMGEMDRVKGQYQAAKIDLGDLRAGGASADQIRAAEQNVAALEARYESLNKALEDPAIAKQVKDIQLFTQELAKAGTFVMNVAKTIGGILSPAINFLGTNLTATIATITSFYIGFQTARLAAMALMGVLLLYRGISTMLGLSTAAQQATALSGAFNVLGVNASRANVALIGTRVALTALVAATVVGAVVAGIIAIASAFATMGDKARDAAQASKDASKAAMDAASTGNVAGAEMGVQAVLAESRKNTAARKALIAIQRRSTPDQRKGAVPMNITSEESVALQGSALTAEIVKAGVSRGGIRQIQALTKESMDTIWKQFGSLAGQAAIDLKEAKAAVDQARKVSAKTGLNKPTPKPTVDDPSKDKTKGLESYYKLEDDLAKAVTQGEIDKANMLFEHRKNLLDTYYDLQDARANSFQKATIRFQREVANIEMERQKNVLNAQNNVRKAEGSVAGGAGGATGLLQGSTGVSSGAHFDVRRQDGGYISPQQARALFDASVAKQLQLTSSYGPRRAPVAGASTFHRGVDLAGPANTPLNLAQGYSMVGAGMKGGLGYTASVRGPKGEMYDVGHLQRPAAGAGTARKVTGNESRDINAAQKTQIELDKENLALRQANVLALEKQRVATENYVASIMPVAELELQNQLQDRRNQLQLAGVSDAVLEYEMAKTKATLEQVTVEQALQALKEKKAKMPLTDVETVQLEQLQKSLDELKAKHPAFYAGLAGKQAGQIQSAYSSNMGSLKNQLQLAGIIDPYEEQRQKYMQGGQSAEQADAQVQAQKQLDTVTKLRDSYRELASTIGSSFGDAFKGIITGSMTAQEALASFFQNLSNYFADMVSKMIAEWLKVEAIKGLKSLLPNLFGGGAGFAFTGDSGFGAAAFGSGFQVPGFEFANGGIAPGGFRAFATGGIVTGPTLGLVGEGRYNEAVIPLPDGKSVPVDLGGMSGGMSNAPIMVNVSVDAKGSTVEGDESKANDLGRAISVAVQSELVKQQRPGGLLASTRR